VTNMAFSEREQSFCVLEYTTTLSVGTVQRRFRSECHKAETVLNNIKKWYEKFQDEFCLCTCPLLGRPESSEDTVNRVR
jgi:hypothetical protein